MDRWGTESVCGLKRDIVTALTGRRRGMVADVRLLTAKDFPAIMSPSGEDEVGRVSLWQGCP